MISTLLLAMLPLIALMLVGAILAKRTSCLDGPAMNQLVSLVGIPALLLHSMQTMETSLTELTNLMLAAFLFLISMATFAMAWLMPFLKTPQRYLPAVVNPNAAYLGLPVCVALFGDEAVLPVMVFSSMIQVSHFTLGTACLSSRWQPATLLKNPPIISMVIALTLLALDLKLPKPALDTLSTLGQITLPLMLMQLGAAIVRLPFAQGISWQRPLGLALLRTIGGSMIAALVFSGWPMAYRDYLIFVILAAMPVAVISHAMAQHHQGPADDIALTILLSLPLSLFSVGAIQQLL